jgi:hypothetical protein
MITGRTLMIAVLCTFCLAVSIFSIMPVSSIGTYDPWLDSNDDGKIDLKDYFAVGKAYGTSGDPTKNVNVTNWPQPELDYEILRIGRCNMTGASGTNVLNYTGGYSRVSLSVSVASMKQMETDYSITLSIYSWTWLAGGASSIEHPVFALTVTRTGGGFSYTATTPLMLETKAPYFRIYFTTSTTYPQAANVWALFDVWVYLRNE